jgi:hypothetical protein
MATAELDIGRLLRVRGMVSNATQAEANHLTGAALTRAYMGLRGELLLGLSGALREEFERLFEPLEIPREFNPYAGDNPAVFTQHATEALLSLRRLEGWIQGLIDQATLEQRMRIEAEEKAKWEAKQPPGFGS